MNYVPRKNWWYAWQDWDSKSVAEDLQSISKLGMDHVRIHCLWPFFQPGVNYVSSLATARLAELLDIAEEAELDVEVAVLNGWLSGYSFLPSWVAPLSREMSIFKKPEIIEAEVLLFRSLADVIGKHRRFLGFDLGNEINCLLRTAGNEASRRELDKWAEGMLKKLEQIAPGKINVNGADDVPWFADSGFSRSNLATTGSLTVLHFYAYWTGALRYYRYNDLGSLHALEFMVELAKAHQRNESRRVWVQEVGASPEWMPEEYIPEYASVLLRNAASCGNIWGFTWWCSHDIEARHKGFLSLEYKLGLFDQKNRPKPIAKILAKIAEEFRLRPVRVIERSTAIVIPDHVFPGNREGEAEGKNGWRVARKFMALIEKGIRPTIILESLASDEEYLRARGIEDLIAVS